MRPWLERRLPRLHRTTAVVLLMCLCTTAVGFGFTAHLVDQGEDRVLRQQTAQAALVLASLLNQTSAATGAVAGALRADGTVDQDRFARTSAVLQLPQTSGGAGLLGSALIDVRSGRVLARSGSVLLDPTSSTGRRELAAAAARRTLSLVALNKVGSRRSMGLLAPAVGTTVAYVELPLTETTVYVPDLPGKPFAGVDFAVYFGSAETADALVMTNSRTLPLTGRRASATAGATITEAFEATGGAGPLLIVLHPRAPLTGRTAALFPWMLLGMSVLGALAVLVLLEKTQRRRDEALVLVQRLEERNAEVEEAVDRQARAEERLRQAQRLEAVGQLAGGIAHDFNNLLAVMFSYLGFLRTEAQGQPWLEDVDEVDKAARRAAELTQQLLMFSRRDIARSDVMDLRALLADRHRLLQRTLSDDIDVVVDIPDHPMPVRADAVELDQVVMNLAVNARDAMPEGGTLTLVLDEVPCEDQRQPCLRLRVTDTGVGMDAEVVDHAFEPFYTTKEVGRGTGLGLATVYGIVSRWGGSVTLCSAPGAGTTVTVLLPRSDDALPPDVVEDGAAPEGTRTAATVLLVEDEDGVRRASTRILREAGFDVVEAANGQEALQLFGAQHVDVLVSDVVMPGGLSGADLADRLRLVQPDLPVVFTSGYGRDHLARRGPLPGGTLLLRKPFPAETLVDAVRRSLESEGALA